MNIYEEEHDLTKEYIFVSNHISYLDIPMMMKAIRRQHIRILGKVEMSTIPIFGMIYRKAVVVVDRDNAAQKKSSVKHLIEFLKLHISVFICPEGTFNTTHCPLKSFYNGAFKIAIETQNPIRPILFLDTYDRLNYKSVFSFNPGRCRAVYLSEISTIGLTLQDVGSLKEKVYKQMEEALIRYKASWIKEEKCQN
ncbi:MAG: lysophospholipid acyltransferase family protein [Ginsengibacter sp.]